MATYNDDIARIKSIATKTAYVMIKYKIKEATMGNISIQVTDKGIVVTPKININNEEPILITFTDLFC